jgi:hypothetical protein
MRDAKWKGKRPPKGGENEKKKRWIRSAYPIPDLFGYGDYARESEWLKTRERLSIGWNDLWGFERYYILPTNLEERFGNNFVYVKWNSGSKV